MPFPLTPPPPNDTGGLTYPRTLQKWLDVNPISKLTRTQAYIVLPVFSQPTNWLGYSDIVASFNFEGPNNFSLVAVGNKTEDELLSQVQTGSVIGTETGNGGMI